MSYWVSLNDAEGRHCVVDSHVEGGTHVLGGTTEADLNITYNYGAFFRTHLDKENGLRALHGQKAGDWIEPLAVAVKALGTEAADIYWAATPGNAGRALSVLLKWAQQHPDATWEVS
jgi:hypothetical protein